MGHRPPAGPAFTGPGAPDRIGLLPACAALAIALTQSYWGVPPEVLEGLGQLLQAPWAMAAHVGRSPGGAARLAAILPQAKRVEAPLGGLESVDGLCTRPTPIPDRLVLDRGEVDGGEIARTPQAGPRPGVPPVGLEAIASLLRTQGRSDDPADVPLLASVAVEPRAAWSRFLDNDPMRGLGWPLADAVVNVPWAWTAGPERGDLGAVRLSPVGHRPRLLRDISAEAQRARLVHG